MQFCLRDVCRCSSFDTAARDRLYFALSTNLRAMNMRCFKQNAANDMIDGSRFLCFCFMIFSIAFRVTWRIAGVRFEKRIEH